MLKVGIIGAGRIGKVHGESISKYVKNAEVKAIADVFLNEATINWAREIGIQGVYKDYKKILEDPEIDAILICSSTDTHSKISIEAIRAGKHVFCEKPIDHDLARIKEVIDELNKSNVKYQVGFNRRYDHNFKAIRNAVVEGKIGEPHVLKITSRDPEPPSIDYVKVSGGIFLDMTIHDFDMARYLLGSDVVEVYAAGNVLVDNAIGEAGDIDTAIITLKMANGAMAVIDNSRQSAYGYDQRAEVFGSLGQVSVGNDSISKAVISTKDGVAAEKPLFFFLERYMQAYADEITEFIDAIVNNKDVSVSADDGLKAVLIGDAATKSLKENRPVRISEIVY
ncbi:MULTISPECIES: inositol 2-dehydrogenase [Clostridium]|jgi:myo-inositol 2-dehydrogenase (EC 1.1.1.18)|uniref:Inositol 2-dehydrogenase n=2 Tax=Clostridium beijerinckii TaxID=1520 RepID=A0A1S8R0G3_CLOBE|nr:MULTISPECIES: inositol 2-dehydrogenase [Clostridium]ABR36656.1 oxidoreductase domain protein [Clostridium beijerinckii NCIMB 8052]AIU02958.1 oxidoreductase domain-containing protein [Clostridium beijerinckii ATCC 35702]MBF7808699.1 inositol 2-dehydrogenase [Clostridium beijerinckii]NOW89179.1 myo-inositol 2-dehydrogenase/D-chiro-inositol 1-dehydrogenase [Clostridium beijerinckii]NRT22274.1 myo-inositol 2-dehydrogenase/D-chiro-inositol 1-dehydrogenase [Clostridium beijerinckii]